MLTLFVVILIFITPCLIKTEPMHSIVDNLLFGVYCIYMSYLLIYKKSYNLLAGITEEEYERIQKNKEEKIKVEKMAKIMGYIVLFSGIIMLFLAYLKLR